MWNIEKVLSKHLVKEVNDYKLFLQYYKIFKRQGHVSISMNSFFQTCRGLVRNSEFIAQHIPEVIHEQVSLQKPLFMSSGQYIIDLQGFRISAHEFIMREFCIVSCDAGLLFHCLVKLHCEITEFGVGNQKQVESLTQNFHNLEWDTSYGYNITHIRRRIFQCVQVMLYSFVQVLKKCS